MGFVFKRDEAAIETAGAGGSLETGLHKIKIAGAYLVQDKSDNYRVDLEFESDTGGKATVFGLCVQENWNTGKKNYDYEKFQEFIAVACPNFTGATVDGKRKDFNGKEEDAKILTELIGKEALIALQVELDWYNGKEKKIRNLYRTFYTTGHSIIEKKLGKDVKDSKALAKTIKDYENKRYVAAKNGESTVGENQTQDNAPSQEDDDIEL